MMGTFETQSTKIPWPSPDVDRQIGLHATWKTFIDNDDGLY